MRPDRDQDHHGLLWNRVVRVLCDLQTAFPCHNHHRSAYDYDHPAGYDNDHGADDYDNDHGADDNYVYVYNAAAYRPGPVHDHDAVPAASDAANDDYDQAAYHDDDTAHYDHDCSPVYNDVYDDSGGLVGLV